MKEYKISRKQLDEALEARNQWIRGIALKPINKKRLPYMYEVRDMIAKKGITLSTEQVRMIVKGE